MTGLPQTSADRVRLLLYRKQPSDVCPQFVCFAHGGVSAFGPLPRKAQVLTGEQCGSRSPDPPSAPAPLVGAAQRYFDLPEGSLEVDERFRVCLKGDKEPVEVYLAQFTTTDPPFEAMDRKRARFLELTEARDLCPTERELLEKAYHTIMD